MPSRAGDKVAEPEEVSDDEGLDFYPATDRKLRVNGRHFDYYKSVAAGRWGLSRRAPQGLHYRPAWQPKRLSTMTHLGFTGTVGLPVGSGPLCFACRSATLWEGWQ